MNDKFLTNLGILFVLFIILVVYGVDMRIPYPRWVIQLYNEPLVRICTYAFIYHVAYYNPVISIFMLMCIVFLHLDIINLQAPIKND